MFIVWGSIAREICSQSVWGLTIFETIGITCLKCFKWIKRKYNFLFQSLCLNETYFCLQEPLMHLISLFLNFFGVNIPIFNDFCLCIGYVKTCITIQYIFIKQAYMLLLYSSRMPTFWREENSWMLYMSSIFFKTRPQSGQVRNSLQFSIPGNHCRWLHNLVLFLAERRHFLKAFLKVHFALGTILIELFRDKVHA